MIACLFPGQGSQRPGMGKELYDEAPGARSVFDTVSHSTRIDVAKLCFEADDETLRQTQNAQLALYTCGVAAHAALRGAYPNVAPRMMAGHSVGEYAALASAGILSIEDGAMLVRKRGELMAASGSSRPGTMAAVLGLDVETVEHICKQVSSGSVVVPANDNCPGQLVISGDTDLVVAVTTRLTEAGAKRVLPLNVSGAFHSPLMHSAAEALGEELDRAHFGFPTGDARVYSNVTTESPTDPSEWRALLRAQLESPVRWTQSIRNMVRDGMTLAIECGVGEVLTGLNKRIDPSIVSLKVSDGASLAAMAEYAGATV